MVKQAFLVCGPEASGNRYLVSLLCSAGCAGKSSQNQPFDAFNGYNWAIRLPNDKPDLFAFHRSFPHGRIWPDMISIIRYLQNQGYLVTVLVMIRNQDIVEQSQVRSMHVANILEARSNIKKAFNLINISLTRVNVDFYFVSYSDLAKKSYVDWLFGQLGLTLSNPEPFVDGDTKYTKVS